MIRAVIFGLLVGALGCVRRDDTVALAQCEMKCASVARACHVRRAESAVRGGEVVPDECVCECTFFWPRSVVDGGAK